MRQHPNPAETDTAADSRLDSTRRLDERARLRRVFIQVMIVQVIALVMLWLLQSRFGNG